MTKADDDKAKADAEAKARADAKAKADAKTAAKAAAQEVGGDDMTALIRQAATALDPRIDGDWQPDGRPTLKAIRFLARDASITQDQLNAALPEMRRPAKDDYSAKDVQLVANVPIPREKEEKPPRLVNVRVVATERGYYGGTLREPGESFVFSGIPGKWMRPETAEERKNRVAADEARAESPTPRPDVWAHEISKSPVV